MAPQLHLRPQSVSFGFFRDIHKMLWELVCDVIKCTDGCCYDQVLRKELNKPKLIRIVIILLRQIMSLIEKCSRKYQCYCWEKWLISEISEVLYISNSNKPLIRLSFYHNSVRVCNTAAHTHTLFLQNSFYESSLSTIQHLQHASQHWNYWHSDVSVGLFYFLFLFFFYKVTFTQCL